MRSPVSLVLVVALASAAVSACGGSSHHPRVAGSPSSSRVDTPSTTSSPVATSSHYVSYVSLDRARQLWKRASDRLTADNSGRYTWRVALGARTVFVEHGDYMLSPMKTSSERALKYPLPAGADPDKYVIKFKRMLSTTYMQMNWRGSWSGCWLRYTNADLSAQAGVDMSGAAALPPPIIALATTKVTAPTGEGFGYPYRDFTSSVSALLAVGILGPSPRFVLPYRAKLTKPKVSITVTIDSSGHVRGLTADGSLIADELRTAGVKLAPALTAYIADAKAVVHVGTFGVGVDTNVPSALLLPADARKNDSCPGHR